MQLLSVVQSNRYSRWTNILISFIIGQGALQFINLVTGFFLLRWMSKADYAQYSIAFGFQSTLGLLVELGFGGSIIALVGNRVDDKLVVGNYISAARYFRNRLFLLISPFALISYFYLTLKHNWDLTTQIFLFTSIIISIYIQGYTGYYNSLLRMHKKVKESFSAQIQSGLFRLIISYCLSILSMLNSILLAWVNVLVLIWNGIAFKRISKSLSIEPKTSSKDTRKEMLKYIKPLIPGVIFTAIQGQITIFLISLFGEVENIAEVAALGRISQIFLFLSAFNSMIVAPYIAKVHSQILSKRYFQFVLLGVLLCLPIIFATYIFPEIILWLLGSKYSHLENEIHYVVLSSSIGYLSSLLWTMNSSRKWLFWWGTFSYIFFLIIIQILSINYIDLSNTVGVLQFNLNTGIAAIMVQLIIGVYGLRISRERL